MKMPASYQTNPGSHADHSETEMLQRRLIGSAEALSAMAADVAIARHVREYDSDRRKRCLAVSMAPLIKAGESAAKAEAEARASELYEAALKQLGKEYVAAEKVLCEWDAAKIQWETTRSLLSMNRETMKQL